MPITALDRFVPFRVPVSDRFRANKQPHELSALERLARTDEAGLDAFCYIRKRATRAPRRGCRSDIGERRIGTVLDVQSPERQVSNGAVWSVGGIVPGGGVAAVDGGRGRNFSSGTNALLYTTSFAASRPKSEEEQEAHEGRLALALKIDRVSRVLDFDGYSTFPRSRRKGRPALPHFKTTWTGTEWSNDSFSPSAVLDAPGLRDDFYCSIMAYSKNCNTLAVGLGNLLYGWSESSGVTLLNAGRKDASWLTSLAFSSELGGKSILAFGRSNGSLSLLSLFDSLIPRFEAQQPAPVACLAWRPTPTVRPSLNDLNPGVPVKTEDLLVGDEMGEEVARENFPGAMTLLARIKVHSQQICGLSWSPNGRQFATGGNDNLCCLFNVDQVIGVDTDGSTGAGSGPGSPGSTEGVTPRSCPGDAFSRSNARGCVHRIPAGSERHRWRHAAAVKAIAFCPWREGLVATGGGSNDKCIHFYHTTSGAALATISVAAQVTSLIWSTTRREIAATFGYAQPDHPYRIAVFSWPDCRQVAAIPWDDGMHRALYAIAYPGGPSDIYRTRERLKSRTAEEGCIVMAGRKATTLGSGVLAGSDILEMGEGIDKEGDVIR
ncbi:WD40 repeat-like protein [Xylariomycetidae sp. FL0641]|nr:WD40 repeat-like protein [Xylariomycetidae sp. FL0641]